MVCTSAEWHPNAPTPSVSNCSRWVTGILQKQGYLLGQYPGVYRPRALGSRVGQRTRRSAGSRRFAQYVALNMVDHSHLWQRLIAGNSQTQCAGIEIDLRIGHDRMLIPAMFIVPSREVAVLYMTPGVRIVIWRRCPFKQALEFFRHIDICVSVGLVVCIQEDNGGLTAFGENIVRNIVV